MPRELEEGSRMPHAIIAIEQLPLRIEADCKLAMQGAVPPKLYLLPHRKIEPIAI